MRPVPSLSLRAPVLALTLKVTTWPWLALAALGAGCVTPAQQAPRSPALPPSVPPVAPPSQPPAPSVLPSETSPVAPPEAGPPPARRLPWVNPARCLPTCALDPTPNLVRVNRQGEPDPRGRYQLLAEVQPALVALIAAARAAGHVLRIESAFRSYDEQARLFATIEKKGEQGRAARPGHSEHQLGSTIDLRLPSSAAIEWLAAHAAEHGFALSYPPDKQRITGYRPEPWHVRYVGRELAEELHKEHRTLEEHFRTRPGLGESGSCGDCPLPASRTACGEVSAAGSCSGTVLLWCYDGALNAVDCAVSGQQCGRAAGSDQSDCLPKPLASAPASPPLQSLAAR